MMMNAFMVQLLTKRETSNTSHITSKVSKMVDKKVQIEHSIETLLNIANSNKPADCGKCADLELQLLQA
jgi:hypothetical protein